MTGLGLTLVALIVLVVLRPSIAVTVGIIVGLVLTIMLHEWGHYIAAKKSGMKVTEFFLGFGPRLWSVRKGETEYGIKAIPFGGYVKIIGMSNLERDIDPADEPRTYRQGSYPKRMLVALAGVATHFLMAFTLLVILLSAVGVRMAVVSAIVAALIDAERRTPPGMPACNTALQRSAVQPLLLRTTSAGIDWHRAIM